MQTILKKGFLGLGVAVLLGATLVWYFIFYRPTHQQRDMTQVAVITTAVELVHDFQTNEASANQRYLNKLIQLTGEVVDTARNQLGQTTLLLKSSDDFTSVYCTLQQAQPGVPGNSVTVVGVCTGFLTDVVLSEAIIK